MALHHILVVHDSPAVRETVGILLAGDYEVQAMEAAQYLAQRVFDPAPRLVIASPSVCDRPLPDGAAVVWVYDGGGRLPSGLVLVRHFSPRELRRTVAAALAQTGGKEIIGTLAGDDTLLVIARNPRMRQLVEARLAALAR